MVIKTNGLAIALKKVASDAVKGLSMEEGPSKFKLPNNLGNLGGGDVNAKVRGLGLVTQLVNQSKYFSETKANKHTNKPQAFMVIRTWRN